MDPANRKLQRVVVAGKEDTEPERINGDTAARIEALMGRKAERRFAFIQEHARFAQDLDV